jgi:hypothetical protein
MDGAPLEYPDDDTGDALRRLWRNGDDLTEPRDVDFTVVFAIEVAASEFAEHFKKLGYKVSIKESNCVPDLPWDVLVVGHMVPSHAEISEVENELQVIADGLGGHNDGWGCFSKKDHPRTS